MSLLVGSHPAQHQARQGLEPGFATSDAWEDQRGITQAGSQTDGLQTMSSEAPGLRWNQTAEMGSVTTAGQDGPACRSGRNSPVAFVTPPQHHQQHGWRRIARAGRGTKPGADFRTMGGNRAGANCCTPATGVKRGSDSKPPLVHRSGVLSAE